MKIWDLWDHPVLGADFVGVMTEASGQFKLVDGTLEGKLSEPRERSFPGLGWYCL